jgi:hypothetical protein
MDNSLPPLQINQNTITAFGASSGAFYASMMFLIDPEMFKGLVSLVAGMPLFDLDWSMPRSSMAKREVTDFDAYMKELRDREARG